MSQVLCLTISVTTGAVLKTGYKYLCTVRPILQHQLPGSISEIIVPSFSLQTPGAAWGNLQDQLKFSIGELLQWFLTLLWKQLEFGFPPHVMSVHYLKWQQDQPAEFLSHPGNLWLCWVCTLAQPGYTATLWLQLVTNKFIWMLYTS